MPNDDSKKTEPQDSSSNIQTSTPVGSSNDTLTSTASQTTGDDQTNQSATPVFLTQAIGNQNPNTSNNETADDILSDKDPESVITSSHVPRKYGGKKIIAAILGILLLVGSVGTGVYLIGQQQEIRIGAWCCDKYVFEVSREGIVKTINGSTRNEPGQKAKVSIDNVLITTLDVPALKAGEAATIGNVSVPSDQGFSWKVVGTVDCDDSGSHEPTTVPTEPPQATPTTQPCKPEASCTQIKTYDDQWDLITDLSSLSSGEVVRFSVSGTTNTGAIQKARFSVNDVGTGETANKKPATDEFYIEYTIPESTTGFSVKAELYHSKFGWF